MMHEPATLLEELERCLRLLKATTDPAVNDALQKRIEEIREVLDGNPEVRHDKGRDCLRRPA